MGLGMKGEGDGEGGEGFFKLSREEEGGQAAEACPQGRGAGDGEGRQEPRRQSQKAIAQAAFKPFTELSEGWGVHRQRNSRWVAQIPLFAKSPNSGNLAAYALFVADDGCVAVGFVGVQGPVPAVV